MKYIYLIPLYWLMASTSAVIALYQLIVKPHYWEKTIHGLHLDKTLIKAQKIQSEIVEEVKEEIIPEVTKELIGDPWYKKIKNKLSSKQGLITSSIFIFSSLVAGLLNLGFNVYLGRAVNFEELGLVTLVNGLLYFSNIPQIALSSTVTHQVGFYEGKKNPEIGITFFRSATKIFLIISYILSAAWLFSMPFLNKFFNTPTLLPLLLFTPVWIFGIASALIKGFLSGKLLLTKISLILIAEPVFKFFAAISLIYFGLSSFVYASIPLSIVATFFIGLYLASEFFKPVSNKKINKKETSFPLKFFLGSTLSFLAPMAFLSLDVLLAQHYLSPEEAGKYALISLIGKIIYFLGVLVPQLIMPIVSRNEGANKNSSRILAYVFVATFLFTVSGYVFWGILGGLTAPLVFGEKALVITHLLEPFTFAMVCFSLSQIFVTYYLAKKIYTFPIVAFLLSFVQFALIYMSHQSVESIVWDMFFVSLLNLLIMSSLHLISPLVKVFENNFSDFLELLSKKKKYENLSDKKTNVLIFNWRDTKHVWAGGAEAYVHELSKVWVSEGLSVTLFCGNDGKHARNEVVDGIQVVRRGGLYTVYVWAFLYYILRFRGKYDIVIESANGIPFFTPFYVGKPTILIIHHIHQEVFRKHLMFGFSHFARFLEGVVMPLIYKNRKVVTISQSTKDEIFKLRFNKKNEIEIVHPGVETTSYKRMEKTKNPTFLYLGRLQAYKNIDVAIKAMKQVVKIHPNAKLIIAGFGESLKTLKQLSKDLGIEENIEFLGRVTDEQKKKLMAQSWVMLQPSMIEGWGITVIEANAAGTTVIASNVNGLKDSVIHGETGFLVNPKNVDLFASTMINLIEDSKSRTALSNEAYKWAQNFSWKQSGIKMLGIIKEELEKPIKVRLISSQALAK